LKNKSFFLCVTAADSSRRGWSITFFISTTKNFFLLIAVAYVCDTSLLFVRMTGLRSGLLSPSLLYDSLCCSREVLVNISRDFLTI
jgi:hypothetical protein